ncbi:alpha-L-rhamnosidase A precursor [Aspergillus pseudodeflectus]|uniref:Alpha-L-rhamnosidase A n=1 Tax=Aspergillus pseudodeflectus TaxID=176178 RepID=A0ABR4JC17_9EURO
MHLHSLICLAGALACCPVASAIPYQGYILAPESRILHPVSVKSLIGPVRNADALLDGGRGTASLYGRSSVTCDFGKNIGGLVSIDVAGLVGELADPKVGITFSESSQFISTESSDGQSDGGRGEKVFLNVTEPKGRYTLPKDRIRGGFRYLTLSADLEHEDDGIQLSAVTVYFTPVPHRDPRDYTGYFHSDDELLNRIWYAGSYTVQLNTIDPTTGESNFGGRTAQGTYTWSLNTTVCESDAACLVDGAKRDRLVWPGDLMIQAQTVAVSTNDMVPLRDSIESLFVGQHGNGMLPYLGWDFQGRKHGYVSFTYHLHNLITLAHYARFSGDTEYLAAKWPAFKKAIEWSLSHVDASGLMNVTSNRDWLRVGMGGHNIEANAILYYTLNLGSKLARTLNDEIATTNWTVHAERIKQQANALLWDAEANLYTDNETTSLHPQDGNVWAILSNLTYDHHQASAITSALRSRWGPYGAPAPEAPGTTISPFISGLEGEANFLIGNAVAALDLIRLQWGYMLDGEVMTNSTFVEGYSTDGSLNYQAYRENSRISHAHGWSTAPTYLLSTYVGGIRILEEGGLRWRMEPMLGDLKRVETGFSTARGRFTVDIRADGVGHIQTSEFCSPRSTQGTFLLPQAGWLYQGKRKVSVQAWRQTGSLPGGCWHFKARDRS